MQYLNAMYGNKQATFWWWHYVPYNKYVQSWCGWNVIALYKKHCDIPTENQTYPQTDI